MTALEQDDKAVFKKCPDCGYAWSERAAMLSDPEVAVIGYQAHFRKLTAGLFLFNHICGGTFALPARAFTDLYDGPIFNGRKTGTSECPEYCLRKDELARCPAQCECAYVREILQIAREWPKKAR